MTTAKEKEDRRNQIIKAKVGPERRTTCTCGAKAKTKTKKVSAK